MRTAIIVPTSVTYAIRAQKLLDAHGIYTGIKKTTRGMKSNSCGYGLEIYAADLDMAVSIISSAGIRIVNIVEQG